MRRGDRSGGLKLNNPGLMRRSMGDVRGLAASQPGGDLLAFEKATFGIRAVADKLISLAAEAEGQTLRAVLGRWAALNGREGDFIDSVAKLAGLDLDARLDLTRYKTLRPLVDAIIHQENGRQPYTDGQLVKGLLMAGVEPDKRPLDQSRTMRGGILAIVLTLAASVIETVRDDPDRAQLLLRQWLPDGERWLLEAMPHMESAQWASQIFTLAALGLVLWARLDDRRKGLR